jgi:hypothetical protein
MGMCGIERRFLDIISRITDACAYIPQAGDLRRTSDKPYGKWDNRRNMSFVLAPYSDPPVPSADAMQLYQINEAV